LSKQQPKPGDAPVGLQFQKTLSKISTLNLDTVKTLTAKKYSTNLVEPLRSKMCLRNHFYEGLLQKDKANHLF